MPAATSPHAHLRPVIRIKRMAITAAASCKLVETTRMTATNIIPPTRGVRQTGDLPRLE